MEELLVSPHRFIFASTSHHHPSARFFLPPTTPFRFSSLQLKKRIAPPKSSLNRSIHPRVARLSLLLGFTGSGAPTFLLRRCPSSPLLSIFCARVPRSGVAAAQFLVRPPLTDAHLHVDVPSSTMASDRGGDACPFWGSKEDQAAVTDEHVLVTLHRGSPTGGGTGELHRRRNGRALQAAQRESSDPSMGVGTQIDVTILHKTMVNAPSRGHHPSSSGK